MVCIKCDKELSQCECPDAAERIRNILKPHVHLFIGPEYRERLEKRAKELETTKTVTE